MSDRILILGAGGQLGRRLSERLPDARALTRVEADLSEPHKVAELVRSLRPAVVLNAAAYTAVDRAESEPELAHTVNAAAPAAVAEACAELGSRLVHFSTDYVFDGTKTTPYVERDRTNPQSVYGRTKLEGEEAVLAADPRHLVFRLSWVYDTVGKNFALTMLRLAREGRPIRVVADQIGSPSFAPHLAEAVAAILERVGDGEGGLFHLTAPGQTSWHGFAAKLLKPLGKTPEPITTAEYPTPAKRPAYSVMSSEKAGRRFEVRLPAWEEGVARWIREAA